MPPFHRFERVIGIDYSGAASPETPLPGLRLHQSEADGEPVELRPAPRSAQHWSREGVARHLDRILDSPEPTLVGIDHGFSFPAAYFGRHRIPEEWGCFLEDFRTHWPAHLPGVRVRDIRQGRVGQGCDRDGDARWRRLTERAARGAKSVFHFDCPGSVATSTHAGLPWLAWLRHRHRSRVHFWPFDGWTPPAGNHVVAEVYPSLWTDTEAPTGWTRDQADAWRACCRLRAAVRDGTLMHWFQPDLDPETRRHARFEGWILGVSPGPLPVRDP